MRLFIEMHVPKFSNWRWTKIIFFRTIFLSWMD